MRISKKLLLVLTSFALLAGCASDGSDEESQCPACPECSQCEECPTPHEHQFKDTWSYDESSHWKDAICEHTDLSSERGAHIDVDKDGKCDICVFVLIVHNDHKYEDEWSYSETHHWKGSIDGDGYAKELGEHTFDKDGFCTVCGEETPEHFRKLKMNGINCNTSTTRLKVGEEVTFQILPDEGYTYPASIVANGLTNLEYNYQTGLVKGVAEDEVEVFAKALPSANRYFLKAESRLNLDGTGYRYTYDYNKDTGVVDILYQGYEGEDVIYTSHNLFTYENEKVIEDYDFDDRGDNHRYLFSYYEDGRIKEELRYTPDSSTEELKLTNTRKYEYDDANNTEIRYTYHGNETFWYMKRVTEVKGNVETETVYTKANAESEPEVSSIEEAITTYDYEAGTKTVEKFEYDEEAPGGKMLDSTTVYDLRFNKVLSTRRDYILETYEYNDNGDVVSYKFEVDGEDYPRQEHVFTYDEYGTLVSQKTYEDGLKKSQGSFVHKDDYLLTNATYENKIGEHLVERTFDYYEFSNDEFVPNILLEAGYTSMYDTETLMSVM